MKENDGEANGSSNQRRLSNQKRKNDKSKSDGSNHFKDEGMETTVEIHDEIDHDKFQCHQINSSLEQKASAGCKIIFSFKGKVSGSSCKENKTGRTDIGDPPGKKKQ